MNETTLILVCIGAGSVSGIIAGTIVSSMISKRKSYRNISKLLQKAGKTKEYADLVRMVADQISENMDQHEEMEKSIGIINWERRKNIKKVGYIRYNSTEDIGGNLSFSLVMLNEENSGVILTNIHMREGSSIYLREIKLGGCEITLSEEEKEVLRSTVNK
ncbi:MAG: DUF4446 family protein [Clostridia bacterium]